MKPKRSKISITYNNMSLKERSAAELDISDNMQNLVSSNIEKQEMCDVSAPMSEDDDLNEELRPLMDSEQTETVEPPAIVTEQIIMEEVNNLESIEVMDNPEAILLLETIQTETDDHGIELKDNNVSELQSEIELSDIEIKNNNESDLQSETEHSILELKDNKESELQSDTEYSYKDNNMDIILEQEIVNKDIENIEVCESLEDEHIISECGSENDFEDPLYDGDVVSEVNINHPETIMGQKAKNCYDPPGNCSDCSTLFKDARKEVFGYQAQSPICECHDICVEDARDICVKDRTLRKVIPCTVAENAGCRGGFIPDEPPEIESVRVLCAEESLSPTTGCDRIINKIEFEVVFQFDNTIVVETPKDEFECMFYEFARFPSGVFYSNDLAGVGLNQFRKELGQIDGSCKVIIIEDVFTEIEVNNCFVVIKYKVIDKLWKHENLLVSAIKPYALPGENFNYTIKQEFAQGHKLGVCPGGI